MADVVLTWDRFETFRQARKGFRERPCIYVLIGEDENSCTWVSPATCGSATKGGTGSMVDAALNGTNNTRAFTRRLDRLLGGSRSIRRASIRATCHSLTLIAPSSTAS
jgi:hypothetical protein